MESISARPGAARQRAESVARRPLHRRAAVLRDGIVPQWLIRRRQVSARSVRCPHAPRRAMPGRGHHLVRDTDGTLSRPRGQPPEPSGISYVLENRASMIASCGCCSGTTRCAASDIRQPAARRARHVAARPRARIRPWWCSHRCLQQRYFEMSFSIDKWDGARRGPDLMSRTTCLDAARRRPSSGRLIYRRTTTTFSIRSRSTDSTLGVPGLLSAARAGTVTLANAVATALR